MKNIFRTFLEVAFFAAVLSSCASSSDSWREAARQSLDTGSDAWWDKTRGGR